MKNGSSAGDPVHCLLRLPTCLSYLEGKVHGGKRSVSFRLTCPTSEEGRKSVGLSALGVWHSAAPGKDQRDVYGTYTTCWALSICDE